MSFFLLLLVASFSAQSLAGSAVHIPQDIVKLKKILKGLNPALDTRDVRRIYEYSCARTFLEGEGVSPHAINCVAGQRLGILRSKYHFYLYQSDFDNNFPAYSGSYFSQGICHLNILKFSCSDSVPQIKFGLYKEPVEPFVVAITLARAPEGENVVSNYGYAALKKADGSCPTGLVPISAYRADPESIFMNDPSLGGDNPPSSFVNINGALSDTRVGTVMVEAQPVYRQKNKQRCEGNPPRLGMIVGSCQDATFESPELVRSEVYKRASAEVCALPSETL
ncbi:MAG: hypothetical protein M9962_04320 [Oligoflexia bacterium]|nr:hypothetical protein [Oligoflexia bacterium]